jgi:crotonobetainyl-CoA:carnitine CoA-transferase CaiB-like acyl-CoA transferase
VKLDTGLPKWESDERYEYEPNKAARQYWNDMPQTDPAMECTLPRVLGRPQARGRPATAVGESIEEVSRQVAVGPYRLEQWRERALAVLYSLGPLEGA